MSSRDEEQDELMARLLAEHQRAPHPNLSGERLRLHVAIHAVVETQLEQRTPPETAETLARLEAEGLDPHEARHAIGTVVSDEVSDIMREKKAYDQDRFVARLRDLTAETWRAYLRELEEGDGEGRGTKPPGSGARS